MAHEYKIVAGDRGDVEHAINQYLNAGWRLQGGLSVFPREEKVGYGSVTRGYYSQAIVKYDAAGFLETYGIDA